MQFKVNQNHCVGCGRCTEICKEVFRLEEVEIKGQKNTRSNAYAEPQNDEVLQRAKKASDHCPVEAIEELG